MTIAPSEAIHDLRSNLKGRIILPGEADYDSVRQVWNAMIDRHPAVIVRCRHSEDVQHAIRFARENSLPISVRGAGHNIAGNAVCEGGLMIDFSAMRQVRINTQANRAYVEPGATLHDCDEATQAYGLAVPLGINSTTGVAGLTLGGGFGWLTRKYGMTIDHLLSAEIVTADGEILHADEHEHSDLFWAIRGGGGNFGIVTQFEFMLHPVGPEVLAGLMVFPYEQARQVLGKYREIVDNLPEDLNVWAILRHAPPLPFLPQSVHGSKILALPVFCEGDFAKGEKLIATLRSLGNPLGEHIGAQPYTQWQQAFDPLLTPGARNYWKSHNFTEMSEKAIDAIIEYADHLPSLQSEIFIGLISGAANLVPSDAMAYAHRDAKLVLNVHTRWTDPADDESCISWARAFFKATAPYASAGAYVNFMTEDEGDRVGAAYGANYARLVEIKKRYDPGNVLHFNQNIKP